MLNIRIILGALLIVSIWCAIYFFFKARPVDPQKESSYYYKKGGIYFRDSPEMWIWGYTKVDDVDKATFEILSNFCAKDKDHIYYWGKKQSGVDHQSFYADKNQTLKDKNYVYRKHHRKLSVVKTKDVDVMSFEFLKDENYKYGLKNNWTKDKNNYYHKDIPVAVDYLSFSFVGYQIAFDKNKLYRHNSKIFEAVGSVSNEPKALTRSYVHSNDSVYYVRFIAHEEDRLIRHAVGSTFDFRKISDNVIVIDGQVLYKGLVSPEMDAKSLQEIQIPNDPYSRFYKDNKQAYFNGKVIEKSNPKTFEHVGSKYSKDEQHVFYKTKILQGVDPKTFREDDQKVDLFLDDLGNRFNNRGERRSD